jgi:enoyl-CoA hydratase
MGAASTEVLIHPWVMGLRQAKELLFTGGRLGAAEAKAIGMVNRVVPVDQLDAATLALAQQIAQGPPFAMRILKKSLNRSVDVQGLRQALSAHFDLHQLSHVSEEYQQTRRGGLASAITRGAADRGTSS